MPAQTQKLRTYEDLVLPLMAALEAGLSKGTSPGTAAMGQRQAIMAGRQGEIDRQRQGQEDEIARRERALREKLGGFQVRAAEAGEADRLEKTAREKALLNALQSAQRPEEQKLALAKFGGIERLAESLKIADENRMEIEKEERAFKRQKELKQMDIDNKLKIASFKDSKEDEKLESQKSSSEEYQNILNVLKDISASPSGYTKESGSAFARGKKYLSVQKAGIPTSIAGIGFNEKDQEYFTNLKRIEDMLALSQREKLKGQGQISNYEGQLLARASTIIAEGTADQRLYEIERLRRMFVALKHRADNNIIYSKGKWYQTQRDNTREEITPAEALDLSIENWEAQ